jgi:ankyrin repeat protein
LKPEPTATLTPDDIKKQTQAGAAAIEEMLRRPPECAALARELRSALKFKDVAQCGTLLREKGRWLAEFKGHEQAELMDAAIHADSSADELVALLLQSGVPAHCVYDSIGLDYQHTPLITAARCGRLDLIQKLIAAGADLFWASPTGANALSELLPSGSRQAFRADTPELSKVREWLIQRGLRVDPLCADSRRKMFWASSNRTSWLDVPVLMALGIPLDVTGWTPFMFQFASGHAGAEAAEDLATSELHHRDACKRTPFLLAVSAGDLEVAKALLERGSDLHATGHCGTTALHLAAGNNYCQLLEWLLAAGLPLDVRNEFGNSALYEAVSGNCVDAATLLLQRGADVHERDGNGYGLIHEASVTEDLTMLKLLIKAGAEVNDVSGGGSWPLHDACQSGNVAAVSYLLKVGANPNLTSSGETAIFAAASGDSVECVRLLVEAGANVNAEDCDGWTCLFCLRSEAVAQYLLEQGADPSLRDQCGGLAEDWECIPISIRQKLRKWRNGQ